jgi:hypothetical protein
MKRMILLALLLSAPCGAQEFSPVPYVFAPNTVANASQVMADFQSVVNNGNSVAAALASQIATVTPPPSGAIVFFYLASCPTGWTLQSAWNNLFIRGLDLGRGADPGNTIASIEANGLKLHTHDTGKFGGALAFRGVGGGGSSVSIVTDMILANDVESDVPSSGTGTDVHPINITLKLCKKN